MQVIILATNREAMLREQGGKCLFRRVLEQAAEVTKTPVVICRADALHQLSNKVPLSLSPFYVPVRYTLQGSGMTLLAAKGMLHEDAPVLVVGQEEYPATTLLSFAKAGLQLFAGGADAALLCAAPDAASKFYVTYAPDSTVEHVAPLPTDTALRGALMYKTWATAQQAVYEMAILGTQFDGGYPLELASNNLPTVRAVRI